MFTWGDSRKIFLSQNGFNGWVRAHTRKSFVSVAVAPCEWAFNDVPLLKNKNFHRKYTFSRETQYKLYIYYEPYNNRSEFQLKTLLTFISGQRFYRFLFIQS